MIKAEQVFYWTSNLKGHGFHGNRVTIWYLTSKYYSLSVLSEKPYFLEIGPVHQKGMAIHMYDAENVEFKFPPLRRHLNT